MRWLSPCRTPLGGFLCSLGGGTVNNCTIIGKNRLPPATPKDMMTSSNGNIFRVTGPLCGEFTSHRWIPLTKASDAGFRWSAPWTSGWVNNREAGDLRRHRAHYDVIVMIRWLCTWSGTPKHSWITSILRISYLRIFVYRTYYRILFYFSLRSSYIAQTIRYYLCMHCMYVII